MDTCRFEEQAHLYPFGVLNPREKEQFEIHMKECPACRAIAAEAGGIRSLASALGPAQPLAGLEERILNRLPARAPAAADMRWAFLRRWQRTLIPVSAALCLVLLVAVVFTSPNKKHMASSAASSSQTVVASAANPGGVYVSSNLDEFEQKFLGSDSDTALAVYYENLGASK